MRDRAAWSRRDFLSKAATGAAGLACGALPAGLLWAREAQRRRMNVLFIAVDDLRPTLGCYGDKLVQSPNLDKLAAEGMAFTRTYCQQAVCSPSRNSLLTGRRPDTIGIYDLATHFRTTLPDVVTLPQHFQSQGYHTEGMGKIYHTGHGNYDDVYSWSIPSWPPGMRGPVPKEKKKPGSSDRDSAFLADFHASAAFEQDGSAPQPPPRAPQSAPKQNGPPTGMPDVADNALFDGKLADHAIERLADLKTKDRPFFMAVGFLKPHLPFIAPKRYWDRYDPARFPLEPVKGLPQDAPRYVGNGSGELRTYAGVPKEGPVSDEQARHLIHGYYACISYVDGQIGRVLDALEREGLRDNTVVIVWGDHGWHLGDHGLWAKHTNFERATHSPMIVSAPQMKAKGQTCDALTEFVDIYPGLCDLAGIPKPGGLEGTSFAPLTDNPKRGWKTAAFSQYPRRIEGQNGMGHSIRTDRYRLTEWTIASTPDYSALELYDYRTDPLERVNLAGKQEYEKTTAEMKARLRAGWKAALPPGK